MSIPFGPSVDRTDSATALAAARGRYDPSVLADAARYARAEADTGRARFTALLFDFVADGERRALVYDRLRGHVERRRTEEQDVHGLFAGDGPEPGDGGGE